MRIGILSDTHDHRRRTNRAVRLLVDAGAEALIHCGDLTEPNIVHECGILPSYFVLGNNDDDRDGIEEAIADVRGTCLGYGGILELGGKRLAVTHGDLGREVRRLAAARPDYLLFGHSHIRHDARDGATRWINPGALHRTETWTVALLSIDIDELKFIVVR